MTEMLRTTDTLPAISIPTTAAATTDDDTGLLQNRNFMILWVGQLISLLGDQFFFIALPWLVLQLTGDALATGGVLALAAIPRALFMLVGGAVTDKFSPRSIMIASNIGQMTLVGLLALLVFSGEVQVWMLIPLALMTGLADAFFFPASGAIVPKVVSKAQLSMANTVMRGTEQLSLFVGPVLAGTLIALFGGGVQIDGETSASMTGIGLVIALDALTFLIAIIALSLVRVSSNRQAANADSAAEGTLAMIRAGLLHVWQDQVVRNYFVLIALASVFIVGPTMVGIPLLADKRLPGGAAAFGTIMSAYGGGSLLGMIAAGIRPAPPRWMGTILMVTWSLSGLSLAALGLVSTTLVAVGIAVMMGATDGYVVVQFITWLQQRTPETHLGRVMSLLMFTSIGVAPVSMALAGAVMETNLTLGFIGSGLLMMSIALLGLSNRRMRRMA